MFLCASLTGLRKHLFSSLSFTLDFRDTCPHIYCIKGTKKKKSFFLQRQTTNSTRCQKNLDFFKGEVWLFVDTSRSEQTCVQHHFKLCIKLVPASCLRNRKRLWLNCPRSKEVRAPEPLLLGSAWFTSPSLHSFRLETASFTPEPTALAPLETFP